MALVKPEDELIDRSSYGGSVYDQQYFTDDELRNAAAARTAAKNGETSWASAHDYVEGIRAKYGYSGGSQGDMYTRLESNSVTPQKFTYADAPTWTDRYSGLIDAARETLHNREAFSYDYKTDPNFSQYKQSYTREGQRAAQDALAEAATRTGGMPSTAAVAASQQANDYYMAQLADKIPELRQLAYSMYMDEGNELRRRLNDLVGLQQNDRAMYEQDYANWQNDRNFAYGQYTDNIAMGDTARAEAQTRVDNYFAAGGKLANLDADLISRSGYTTAELKNLEAYYALQAAAQVASKSNSKKSSGSDSANDDAGNGDEGYREYDSSTAMKTQEYNAVLQEIYYALVNGKTDDARKMFYDYAGQMSDKQYNTIKKMLTEGV